MGSPRRYYALLLAPVHQGSALADYTIRNGRLNGLGFGLGLRYVGNAHGDPSNLTNTPSSALADLLLHYDLPRWRRVLNINNLIDTIYLANCSGIDYCNNGSRRTIQFTVSRQW